MPHQHGNNGDIVTKSIQNFISCKNSYTVYVSPIQHSIIYGYRADLPFDIIKTILAEKGPTKYALKVLMRATNTHTKTKFHTYYQTEKKDTNVNNPNEAHKTSFIICDV